MTGIISIFVYKSMRKNSRNDYIQFYIRDNTDPDVAAGIITHMASCVTAIIYNLGSVRPIMSAIVSFTAPNTGYVDVDKNFFNKPENIRLYNDKHEYFSIEQLIYNLYNYYMTINPYCTLSTKTLFDKPSIKYTINKFYRNV